MSGRLNHLLERKLLRARLQKNLSVQKEQRGKRPLASAFPSTLAHKRVKMNVSKGRVK
jgi:hypothetical protein